VCENPWSALDITDAPDPILWACCVGALPFVTVLTPSERSAEPRTMQQTHHRWGAWQVDRARLWPDAWSTSGRVADGTSAMLEFLRNASGVPLVIAITCMRLDTCVFDPALARSPGTRGRYASRASCSPHSPDASLPQGLMCQTDTSFTRTVGEIVATARCP
jgi:hypothetical protein